MIISKHQCYYFLPIASQRTGEIIDVNYKAMTVNYYDNLVQATKKLSERGFDAKFKFDGKQLLSIDTDQTYAADDLQIVEYHRFEGMTNPADSSVIFAIETNANEKGTVIMSYSTDADMQLVSFIDKVKVKASYDAHN